MSPDLRRRPLIFVDDLEAPILDDADLHHFRRVRRLADGAPVTIGDGLGRWRSARFAAHPEPDSAIGTEPAPAHPITVGFAPVKNERPEWVIQKLTELGVDTIVPLHTMRSVVRWDAKRADKQQAKWTNAIREAAMQSRRLRLPVLRPLSSLDDALAFEPGAVLAEPGAAPIGPADRTVFIGPEGGWDDTELAGRALRSLPGGILRAETAAVAAAVLLATSRPS